MRWDRCWFENCREPASLIDLDGQHPRNLCPKHIDGLRKALDVPGAIRISWGRSKADLLVDLESKLSLLTDEHEAAQAAFNEFRDRPVPLDEFGLEPEGYDDEYQRLERVHWRAYAAAGAVAEEISALHRRTTDHPVVRVHVRSD